MLRLATILAIATAVCVDRTPLDEYVNRPDPYYSYRLVTSVNGSEVTTHVINMTSQKWLTDAVSSSPIWYHDLYIIIPDQVDYKDTAFMFISDGNNGDASPNLENGDVRRMTLLAQQTGSVTAVIKQIPNQPIIFPDDQHHSSRTEDAIIAWTWRKFLDNESDADILLRLPMTKAAVRGMDTVSKFVQDHTGNNIDKFMVSGISKRGWTTWTTAAVDKRVIAMAPTVMDLLNFQQSLHHHYRSLGGWTFALRDYYAMNITKDMDTNDVLRLEAVEDPLSYKDRYTMPKLIVTASSDEFFLPDDSHFFYNQLLSVKYMRVIPNSGHGVSAHEEVYTRSLEGFYLNVLERAPFPNVTWVLSQTSTGGKISAKTSRAPRKVTVYYAKTADEVRRDFRQHVFDPTTFSAKVNPVVWVSTNATQISHFDYEANMALPATGWLAFFIEFTFEGVRNSTLEVTTEVNIIPDTYPYPDCSGVSCYGTLV